MLSGVPIKKCGNQDATKIYVETSVVSARDLAVTLVQSGIVPSCEPEDALHVAIATVSKMHYLVTWNFAHLAGPDAKQKLLDGLRALGHSPPLLTTPEELLETAR